MTRTAAREIYHPVIEIFGPTVQGEGHLIGTPVYFVRFGGCEYRCEWCDTKYAVDPLQVKRNAVMKSGSEIMDSLSDLPGNPRWVVLSGGNPALQHLGGLVTLLHEAGFKITVETQGTVYRSWISRVDHVTVSPKPPSSGMETDVTRLRAFLDGCVEASVKIVVFDERDYEWAHALREILGGRWPFYLSVGNNVGEDGRLDLLERLRWLAERTAGDPRMGDVRVLPQLHTLAWGNRRGV